MQLTSDESTSEEVVKDHLLNRIKRESAFISGVLSCLQSVRQYAGEEDQSEAEDSDMEADDDDDSPRAETSETRARTVEELQQRLKDLQAKRPQNTHKMSITDRKLKKNVQDRLKKKKKLIQRHEQKVEKRNLVKQQQLGKAIPEKREKKPKPVFNSEGKMVFSKFDFSVSGGSKESTLTGPRDPKKILEKLKSKEERLAKLAQTGNIDKVIEIKQKDAWQNALQKSEGIKVKDDPELLKKAIKRKESEKKRSTKQWADREKNLKRKMDERQNKRQANIDAKKELRKKQKQKLLTKKGRVIPGF